MARIVPAITYTLGVVLILWLILGAITLPNAGKWFQNASARIEQDVIVLPKNSSSLKEAKMIYGQWKYSDNVLMSANTPAPPVQGLQGVLYDRGLWCTEQPTTNDTISYQLPDSISSNVSKIALIRRGGCAFIQKLMNAQLDGASAAIVYDNTSLGENSDASGGMAVGPDTIYIPAFYVDASIGADILQRLHNLSNVGVGEISKGSVSDVQLVHSREYSGLLARVTLYPSHKPLLDPWQFALILIGAVLLTSIAVIVAMQCHLWRLSRRENAEDALSTTALESSGLAEERFWRSVMGSDLPSMSMHRRKRPRLDPALVHLLPTRVYGDSRMAESEKQDPDADSNEPAKQENAETGSVMTDVCRQDTLTSEDDKPCVICLESYTSGEVLRRLQCQHEFHLDCIDMWLTKKSASCPLCLHDVDPVAWPDRAHTRDQSGSHISITLQDSSPPDLADVWEHLSRQRSVSRRQRPSSHAM